MTGNTKKWFYRKSQKVNHKNYFSFSHNFNKFKNPILDLEDLFNSLMKDKIAKEKIFDFFDKNPTKMKRIISFLEEIKEIKEFWINLELEKGE